MSAPNEALRGHVTRVGFDLSMGKTHVAALVVLAEAIARRGTVDSRTSPLLRTWITATGGLMARGLVEHHYNPKAKGRGLQHHYSITKAGRHVIGLLKEAGIYQEHAEMFAVKATLKAVS